MFLDSSGFGRRELIAFHHYCRNWRNFNVGRETALAVPARGVTISDMGSLPLLLALLLADNGGAPPPRATGSIGPSPERLYAALSPAVVGIDCWPGPIEKPEDPYAYGTGAIIDPRGL